MSCFIPNKTLHFYLVCVGNYQEGDIFVAFYGQDLKAAIREAKRNAKELNYHRLSRPEDPGWAAGDGEHGYVEVRRHHLSQGHAFNDDNTRNAILFPNERIQYDNGKGSN